jgi:hypothetical protein
VTDILALVRSFIVSHDAATANVIADWCEENRYDEIANTLRANEPVRPLAMMHLEALLDPSSVDDPMYRAEEYFSMIDAAAWKDFVGPLQYVDLPDGGAPSVYFARDLAVAKKKVTRIHWALPSNMSHVLHEDDHDRLVPWSALVRIPCPKCDHAGMAVGRQEDDLVQLYALCMVNPHLTAVAISARGFAAK